MDPRREGSNGLEGQLRNLILTNNDGAGPPQPPMHPGLGQPSPTTGGQSAEQQRSSRNRRPNQAQRRQMSAQLSIPVDPRPSVPEYPKTAQPSLPHQQSYASSAYPPQTHYRSQSFQRHLPLGPNPYGQPHQATGFPFQGQPYHHRPGSFNAPTPTLPHATASWRAQAAAGMPQDQGPGPVATDLPSPLSGRRTGILYNPGGRQFQAKPEDISAQEGMLDTLCRDVVTNAEIGYDEIAEKESFRVRIEAICRDVIGRWEVEGSGNKSFSVDTVRLRCFGSLASGFATKASDMDLGLFSPYSALLPDNPESPIPRLVEKAFLEAGLGARLLTKTRVPIIKLCEKPPENLLRQLLRERERWEQGLEIEAVEAPPEKIGDDEAGDHADPTEHDEEREEDEEPAGERAATPDSEAYRRSISLIQQGSKSLQEYYQAARSILCSLGGRDLPKSAKTPFTTRDRQVLNDVARAFVSGLADSSLRGRLQRYRSFDDRTSKGTQLFRSLDGVYTQCQGEYLVMGWEKRPTLHFSVPQEEQRTTEAAQWWKELQDETWFGTDPVHDNAALRRFLTRLKKHTYMQLLSLEQGNDDASQYHKRASWLLHALGGHNPRDTNTAPLRQLLARKFVDGITDESIRSAVSTYVDGGEVHSLSAIARRFKSLWLARDYDKAMALDLFDKEDRKDIEAYTAILRRPMSDGQGGNGLADYFVPTTADDMPLLQRIRLLGDPVVKLQNFQRNRLEFPKSGAGVQCDINFSAHLATHNTQLLRCYSSTDPRVRPLVLFVKHWAKKRGINTPYRGTLSSYGYVLMVLHYLVNVAKPFVCPNLQLLAPASPPDMPAEVEEEFRCRGRNTAFWRDEPEIQRLAAQNLINHNRSPVGALLRGFFEYYANTTATTNPGARGFDWGRDVLSLRSPGGLLGKATKGWTGAVTVVTIQPTFAPQTPGPESATSVRSPFGNDGNTPVDGGGDSQLPSQPVPQEGSTGDPSATISSPGGPSGKQPQQQHAKTPSLSRTASEVKEVRHRYLFAIEDPFELDHNVARTVNRTGVNAIRDEFRRAWRIIKQAGQGQASNLDTLLEDAEGINSEETMRFTTLLADLHGLTNLTQRG